MTFMPIMPPWLFAVAALALLAAVTLLLVRKRSQRRWFMAAITVLLLVACARPGIPGGSMESLSRELDIYFVVDMSPSSAAEDFQGQNTRFSGMESDINAIAAHYPGARFSLITFDASAKVVLPLSEDAGALKTLASVLKPESPGFSQGSSITSARDVLAANLAAAEELSPDRYRMVFYMGDGEQTSAGAPSSFEQKPGLVNGGAVLGYGTAQGGKMRTYEYGLGNPGEYILDPSSSNRTPAISRIDEKLLQVLAGQLKVSYAHRISANGLEKVLALVDKNVSANVVKDAVGTRQGGRTELLWIPALLAFGLFVWEAGQNYVWLRQLGALSPGRRG